MGGDEDMERRGALLADMLELGVAVELPRVFETPLEDLEQVGPESLQTMMETGEAILFRRAPGESGRAFAALSRALAAMACWPGGVKVFGRRWIATHPEARASGWYDQCGAGGENARPGGSAT